MEVEIRSNVLKDDLPIEAYDWPARQRRHDSSVETKPSSAGVVNIDVFASWKIVHVALVTPAQPT